MHFKQGIASPCSVPCRWGRLAGVGAPIGVAFIAVAVFVLNCYFVSGGIVGGFGCCVGCECEVGVEAGGEVVAWACEGLFGNGVVLGSWVRVIL